MSKRKSIAERIWARVIKDNTTEVFTDRGEASLDPTPMAIPVGMSIPETLDQKLMRLFRTEKFRESLAKEGLETFEESMDLDVEDEDDGPVSLYQDPRAVSLASLRSVEDNSTLPPDVAAGTAARDRIRSQKEAAKASKEVPAKAGSESPSE